MALWYIVVQVPSSGYHAELQAFEEPFELAQEKTARFIQPPRIHHKSFTRSSKRHARCRGPEARALAQRRLLPDPLSS